MLTIKYIKKYNFYKVTCSDDNYITDADNTVLAKTLYVPGTTTEEQINNDYHCVTEDEYNTIVAEREAEAEKER